MNNGFFGGGRFQNSNFRVVNAAAAQSWGKSSAALTAWAALHVAGIAFLVVILIISASTGSVVTTPLETIISNNTNALSSSATSPGISFPIVLVVGLAHLVYILWVRARYEEQPANKKDDSMFGLERGIWFSGIYFGLQGAVLLCFAMNQRGLGFGIELFTFIASGIVWMVIARARHQDIKDNKFHLSWMLGNELPYEIYFAAAALGTFWTGLALGIATHDPIIVLSQDKVAVTICAIWFGIVSLGLPAYFISFGLPLFNTVVLIFIWAYATFTTLYPMTAMASIYLALLNFLYFCLGISWVLHMAKVSSGGGSSFKAV